MRFLILLLFPVMASAMPQMYYSPENGIFDADGNRYFLEGAYTFHIIREDVSIEYTRPCWKAEYHTDFHTVPDVEPGTLPGEGCYLRKMDVNEDMGSLRDRTLAEHKAAGDALIEQAKARLARTPTHRAEFCEGYDVQAPANSWSSEIKTIEFYGTARHEFSVQTSWDSYDTDVWTNARYWKFGGWYEQDWKARNVRDFWADGVAGLRAIYLKFMADPTAISAHARVCTFH